MLPAPAQGAIMIVCRSGEEDTFNACHKLDNEATAICTRIERDFLKTLMGGCSTPISALAQIDGDQILFEGNICSPDGKELLATSKTFAIDEWQTAGANAAQDLLAKGAGRIVEAIRNK
jgi:hydroxymethylbilane synthase